MNVVVFSDGETWEVLGPKTVVCSVTKEEFKALEEGESPSDLGLEGTPVMDLLAEADVNEKDYPLDDENVDE